MQDRVSNSHRDCNKVYTIVAMHDSFSESRTPSLAGCNKGQ